MILSLILQTFLLMTYSAVHELDYVEAIIHTESSWVPDKVSSKSAYGLMQVTHWALKDIEKVYYDYTQRIVENGTAGNESPEDILWFVHKCHLERGRPYKEILKESLTDYELNVKIGTCYLFVLKKRYDNDWTKILIAYNGGPRQINKYESGQMIARETANYVMRVKSRKKEGKLRW